MWLLFAGVAPLAHAYEDHATLGAAVGYAHATARGLPHPGVGFALEAGLGLSDIWSVRAVLGYSLHPGAPSLSSFALGGELLYLIDVFEIVPYFGAGVDALASIVHGRSGADAQFGVHPVFGADWLLSRTLALGLEARPVFLVTALDRNPVYVTVAVNASWLLDL